jgi:hypothetical protein
MPVLATFGIPMLGSILTLIADRISGFLRNLFAILTVAATLVSAVMLIPIAKETTSVLCFVFVSWF